jgi:polysaccharide export outer membrane protein
VFLFAIKLLRIKVLNNKHQTIYLRSNTAAYTLLLADRFFFINKKIYFCAKCLLKTILPSPTSIMKKNICKSILWFIVPIVFLNSCANQKKFIYFQNTANQPDTINVSQAYIPKIQPGDILSVPIGSLSSAASSFFNPFAPSSTPSISPSDNSGNATIGVPVSALPQNASTGYLVDPAGNIEIPLLGPVKVGGLTTSAAKDTIKNRLRSWVKEPTVNVRFVNYKISVMGEVVHPAVYIIPNEKVTLPEAISMAGDLTPYARYDNILIIRNDEGKKEFGRVNLNNREVFTSPYYYLHSGDIIYVEQGKIKALQSDPVIRYLPIALSTIAAISLLIYRAR